MKRTAICLFFMGACILSGCASRSPYQFLRDAQLSDGKQKLEFQTSELIPEREIYVYVGDCWTRQTMKAFDKVDENSDAKAWEEAVKQSMIDMAEEAFTKDGGEPMHVRLIVQSMVVVDERVVPNNILGFTTSATLKTNSRFLSMRVEFPDEGDFAEAVIDLKQGTFIEISRSGKLIGFTQRKEEPTFM